MTGPRYGGGYGPHLTGDAAPDMPMVRLWVTNEESGFAHLIERRGYGNPHAKCSLPPYMGWTQDGVTGKSKCGLCLEWERDHG